MSTHELDHPAINGWYELFSRGARDWLRHSDKIRDAVRDHLPQIIAGSDVINHGSRSVQVPVRMLEHYRFRLRPDGEPSGVGQGSAKPGDVLGEPNPSGAAGQKGPGGRGRGGPELMLEFKVDDVIDWLWEDMHLPNLQPKVGPSDETQWKREGWDRRGARSRLDRRRSLKESVKRRASDPGALAFTDDDLRYRQLARRRQPSVHAVVFFLLDVSGSMTERDRQLSKTFFFWVAAGLRREYQSLDIVFVAHTTDAWEFNEADFFKVTGTGGTVASVGLAKVAEIIEGRYASNAPNIYLFYASDGDNASDDSAAARAELARVTARARYSGYVEITAGSPRITMTETSRIFQDVVGKIGPGGRFVISGPDDVATAVRHFFTAESRSAQEAST
jgi:uncharacterized sporulation protein YeaH/YhbH (DUF444 family)